jgi:hypothetical protein
VYNNGQTAERVYILRESGNYVFFCFFFFVIVLSVFPLTLDLGREIVWLRFNAIALCTRPSDRIQLPDDRAAATTAASGYVSVYCVGKAHAVFRLEKSVYDQQERCISHYRWIQGPISYYIIFFCALHANHNTYCMHTRI